MWLSYNGCCITSMNRVWSMRKLTNHDSQSFHKKGKTHFVLYFSFDPVPVLAHDGLEKPTINFLKKEDLKGYPDVSVITIKLLCLSYLAPPVNLTSRSPTWASQLTLVTNGRPSTSLPSLTTKVTDTSKIVTRKDPPSCLSSTQKTKQQQKQTT